MKSNTPYVTVFIPTYYGEEYLDEVLKQVFAQETDFNYEVLVKDTCSGDETPVIINRYLAKHKNMRYQTIEKKDYIHGKVRRDAAFDAKGEIIVYLSQDAVPAHNKWLYEMVKPFELNEKVAGVIGKQTPRANCVPMLKNEINSVFNNLGPDDGTTFFYKDYFVKNQSQYDFISFYSDVNSAGRRSVLTGDVPYQPVAYAEDQLFGRDIIGAGYIKAYAPRGNVIHSNDIALKDYGARMFDETLGLRKVGIPVQRPSLKTVFKIAIKGIIRDAIRLIKDPDYSTKRRLYWLVVNPLYYIEKWKGVRLGAGVDITDELSHTAYSLEEQQRIERSSPKQ